MTMAMVCCSHSPLMLPGRVAPRDASASAEIFAGFETVGAWVKEYDPDVVVIFNPDHFNCFFYELLPAFCIGLEAESTRDWGIAPGKLNVPQDIATAIFDSVRAQGFDPAISYRMRVDHGVTIPLLKVAGALDRYPVVPIWINCAGHPRPSFRRCREFGAAVGRHLAGLEKRVLVIGSGGLSHDPPTPRPGKSPAEELEPFMEKKTPTQDEYDRRETRATNAGIALAEGKGPVLPPSEAWDRAFLAKVMSGDLAACDALTDEAVDRDGGFGAHEVRTWIAANAAMAASGSVQRTLDTYRCIPDWLTGMGIMRAVPG